jgi:uncharacterized protein Yka (UPF0111/DUF47 family)
MARKDPTADLLALLDRLEELREDLLELNVSTLSEIEQRISEIESQLDDVPDDGADGSV